MEISTASDMVHTFMLTERAPLTDMSENDVFINFVAACGFKHSELGKLTPDCLKKARRRVLGFFPDKQAQCKRSSAGAQTINADWDRIRGDSQLERLITWLNSDFNKPSVKKKLDVARDRWNFWKRAVMHDAQKVGTG